ncbi:hypothetical protein GGI07_005285 [Coemansia sp. Benny D115]|nr:hypothetical protein GGI07_005285 [Coemansia sp. Benny D115]
MQNGIGGTIAAASGAQNRQRLSSLHDPNGSRVQSYQQQQQLGIQAGRNKAAASANNAPVHTQTQPVAVETSHPAYITEEYLSYLDGGPFNRFALALKSGLDNEIDWACARLVAATHLVSDAWSIHRQAPSLVEAILGVLERSRRELQLQAPGAGSRRALAAYINNGMQKTLLSDMGPEAVVQRAQERTALLTTALFNLAQINDGAVVMAQDPRVTIEATQWLRLQGVGGSIGVLAGVSAELLDILDIIIPLAPQPPLATPIKLSSSWPQFGSKQAANIDALALVQTCLWEELLRILCLSQEHKLVLGSVRVMVQAVACHPQLAREIIALPCPSWLQTADAGAQGRQRVGEVVNARLAELLLTPDAETVLACLELLLNTVRLEALARALDEERMTATAAAAAAAATAAAAASTKQETTANGAGDMDVSDSSVAQRRRPQRQSRQRGADSADVSSGGESGVQRVLGPKKSRQQLHSLSGPHPSQAQPPTMLPSGLAALVALITAQWVTVIAGPPTDHSQHSSQIMAAAGDSARSGVSGTASSSAQSAANAAAANSRPPTEPELREACTWVLLNYEFVPPPQVPQGQQPQQPTLAVALPDIFSRYMIAKQNQTVPRIGRALNLAEMVRVVAAVFPKSKTHMENQMALHLRPRAAHIVPIPAVSSDAPAQPQQPADGSVPCKWIGCNSRYADEAQAKEHLATHIADADACRWANCNRLPMSAGVSVAQWLPRHILTHGPFYRPPGTAAQTQQQQQQQGSQQTNAASAAAAVDIHELAKNIRNEKLTILDTITPSLSSVTSQRIQVRVFELVLLGIEVLEQLQKWGDRRQGTRGEEERRRIWSSGDDVVERVAFVAAQNTKLAPYASRLLAVISHANIL